MCSELQPRVKGWLLASVDGQKTGLIPGNYVKVLGKRQGTRKQAQLSTETQEVKSSSSCCSKQKPSEKSCCSQPTNPPINPLENPPINPLENPLDQNLDSVYTNNQSVDTNASQALDSVYDNTSEMDAGDIIDKCQE